MNRTPLSEGGDRAPRAAAFGSVSFRVVIAGLFIALMLGVLGVVLSFDYISHTRAALAAADDLIDEVHEKILIKLRLEFEPIAVTLDLLATVPGLDAKSGTVASPARELIVRFLRTHPNVEWMTVAFDNGVIHRITAHPGDGQAELKDAASRPAGVTVARRIEETPGGMLTANVSLARLSRFFAEQDFASGAETFIFAGNGQILAHADAAETLQSPPDPRWSRALTADAAGSGSLMTRELIRLYLSGEAPSIRRMEFDVGGKMHVGKVGPVPIPHGRGEYLAVVAPIDDLVRPVILARNRNIFSGLGLMALSLPALLWLARWLARPLSEIAAEMVKIAKLDIESGGLAASRIEEIASLADSLDKMKFALRIVYCYVPRSLVKNTVAKGKMPELGGERRSITLLFTDVRDYTTVAETLPPEDLMIRTSLYFEEITRGVAARCGSIDKFMGDGAMAIWNAPVIDEQHTFNACLAALEIRDALVVFNDELKRNKFPPMYTRFGLHTGDAVVGNVGSSDRMNYTAVGATVNMAARLESLNKFYGTTILTSEYVMLQMNEKFVFRPVDVVAPKGYASTIGVYELVGGQPGAADVPEALWVSPIKRERCRRFAEAYTAYRGRDWQRAGDLFEALLVENIEDKLSQIYVERAQKYQRQPPPLAWSGEERFQQG